jgi:periplasmic protein TonB
MFVWSSIGLSALLMFMGCGLPPPKKASSVESEPPRIIVGSTLNCGKLVRYVRPAYPKEAKVKHIQGTVEVRAIITKAGGLRNLEILKGDPLLVPAAITAVKQWRYTPCLLNGEAVEWITILALTFNLTQ